MDIAKNISRRLKEILHKLKAINIISSFSLQIQFGTVDEDFRDCLVEVEALLRNCVVKIRSNRRTEIRNIIGELVRTKNTEHSEFYDGSDCREDCYNNSYHTLEHLNDCCSSQKSELEKSLKKDLRSREKSYLCEFCGNMYFKYLEFSRHNCENQGSKVNQKCKESSLQKETTEDLKYHLKKESNSHSGIKFLSRDVDFTNKDQSTTDSRITTDSKIFHSITPKKTSSAKVPPGGRTHSFTNERKSGRLVCYYENCNKSFRIEQSLKKHMRLKHSSNSELRFFCDRCEKSFAEKCKLTRHVLSHERGQLTCPSCLKTFYRMDNLKRHQTLRHENVKPFECRYCKKKFSLRFNRDVHEKNVHVSIFYAIVAEYHEFL
ncbi:UNVERIFIED_CONTAM: hypothetical protein PYX00_007859 [Menopon gallinae]|uniref:C2H2-type domain-containing protein n=1 Tax=Menopon gallinae TaxID=328185 RepID=A0AAW2HKW6_9NEOP